MIHLSQELLKRHNTVTIKRILSLLLMLGNTLPVRLCWEETERGLYILRVRVAPSDAIAVQLHHYQDVIVQEEKDVSWMVQ